MVSDAEQIAEVADRLTQSVGGLRDEIKSLDTRARADERFGRTNRRLIWGLILSLLFDVILTFALAIVAVRAYENHRAQVDNCTSANDLRAGAADLWTFLLELNPHPTPAQKAVGDKIRAKVAEVYAQRDCSHV